MLAIRAEIGRRIRRQIAIFGLRRTLQRMSKAVLRDIGLERDDIADFAADHVDAQGHLCGSLFSR